jgi:hypothetical protein
MDIRVFAHRVFLGTSDIMRVQEGSCCNITTEGADHFKFSYRNVNAIHPLGTDFFVHKGYISAGMMVELVGCDT